MIELFAENPRMGMAVPPAPLHGEYRDLYGKNWGINFNNTQNLCKELDIHVPMRETESPIAPYGSVFWFRPTAMKKLFHKQWKYGDFPEEPLPVDGTVSHAIERCYSFVAQSEGYYSTIIMSDIFERIEYTNLDYFVGNNYVSEELRKRLDDMYNSTSWKVSKPVRILGESLKLIVRKNVNDRNGEQ